MSLTPAQIAVLKAAITAEIDPTFVALRQAGATGAMTEWYNAPSTYVVWRSTTQAADIFDAIVWANLTPADTPDGTAQWQNRSLACQGKQFNIQTLLAGREAIGSGKPNVRAGLQDALTNVPAGAAGANIAAGWATVRVAMQRAANRAEKLYATGLGTAATPGVLAFEGGLVEYDIVQAFLQ